MRIATMILGLVLMLVIGVQSCAAGVSGALSKSSVSADAAGMTLGAQFGAILVLLYLLGASFALGVPLLSMAFFVIAGIVGLSGGSSTAFKDLSVWGGVALILALMSLLGYIGKKRAQRRARKTVITVGT